MSSGDGGKILTQVQNLIERCLRLYMNQKEVLDTLYIQDNIQPHITELVWQKLEEANQEFFKAYYLRLMVKEQIMEFNKLLSQQVELMHRFGPSAQQNFTACRAAENTGPTLRTENMQQPVSSNLCNVLNNRGSSMQAYVQPAVNVASHSRNVDVSANMLLAQSSNTGIANVMDGGMIKSEPGYAGNSSFEFGGHNNFVESRSTLADASISSFSSVESNSKPLNETLLDVDTSSFGFLGPAEHFGLSDPGADFANGSDIYSSSLFLTADSGNFLDPTNEIERMNAAPESLRYQNLGGD